MMPAHRLRTRFLEKTQPWLHGTNDPQKVGPKTTARPENEVARQSGRPCMIGLAMCFPLLLAELTVD